MEKEELIARLKSWILNIIMGIIAGIIVVIIISYGKLIALGVVVMMYEFLTTPIDTFWLVLAILVFVLILAIFTKHIWVTLPERYVLKSVLQRERNYLESELDDKTKQYNELFKKTKPHYSIDKLIKAEVKYNPTGKVGIEGEPSHFIFDIRVINRTNYFFTPKKVFLACYNGKDLVFKEEWEERAKSPHIIPSELQRFADGSIQFHVLKQKIDNNMRELKLKGYVEYATDEDIIHDIQRKSVKVNIANLEYKLDEETTLELKGKVKIAK